MAEQAREKNGSRLAERGRVIRKRILRVAVDMMYVRGVAMTTLDDIGAAGGTSESQLWRHCPDKEALIRDVIALHCREGSC